MTLEIERDLWSGTGKQNFRTGRVFLFPPVLFRPTIVLVCDPRGVAVGVFRRRRTQLEWCAREPLPDNGDWLGHVRDACVRLGKQASVSGPVTLVLPANFVLMKTVPAPRVARAAREKIIRFEAEQALPLALAEVAWTWVDAGDGPSGPEAMLAAVRLDRLEPLCRAVEAAGWSIGRVLPVAWAARAGHCLAQPAQERSLLLVTLAGRDTTLLHRAGARIAARTVTLPGDFSGEAGLAEMLAREIVRTGLSLQNHQGWAEPELVQFAGGPEDAPGFGSRLAGGLGRPVDVLDVGRAFGSAPGVVGIGGALLLFGAAALSEKLDPTDLNLLSTAMVGAFGRRRMLPWFVAAAAFGWAAMIPLWFHYRGLAEAAERKGIAIEREIAPLRVRASRLSAARAQLEDLRQRLSTLRELDRRRRAWPEFFAEVEERLGRVGEVWLDHLQVMPTAGVASKLKISGRLSRGEAGADGDGDAARRFQRLATVLQESPFVSDVEGEWIEKEPEGSCRFGFVLVLAPNRSL